MGLFKRLCASVLAALLLPVSVAAEQTTLPAQWEADDGAYYVVNEDFSLPQPNSYSAIAPSSWDIDDLGGGLGVQGNKSFTVSDNSETLPVRMRRAFQAQTGKITWEFTVTPTVIMDDTLFALREGETPCIGLLINDGKLQLQMLDSLAFLSELQAGKSFGVKVETDIAEKRCTVWVDGRRCMIDAPYLNECAQVDNVYIETGKEATGSMDIGTVRISRGFSVNERFLTSVYELPEDWKKDESGGEILPQKVLGALYPDVYSLKISDNDFLSSSKISRTFSYTGEELWLEYQFLIPEKMDAFSMTLSQKDVDLITLGNKREKFGYTLPGNVFQPVYDMAENIWYHVMLKLTKNGANVYINHKLQAENIDIPFLKVDSIRFETGKTATGYVYLDDIILKAILPEPEDYVPEPEIPEHGDYLVGMQSCNMWKEGSHFGWDWINPFKERHSYLGFYDEGSPEVKDWEIKWMLEHGIDYELFCWYRPPEGDNVPIKYPRSAYALHEGFFNAKYSDKTKFAIAWENGGIGVSGSEDFRKNVVPFWMEQYFKDSRYLVVDNKPVVSIYTLRGLQSAFGDTAAIRAEMDYLRQACVNAGFDGCIILMSSSTQNAAEMQTMKDAGIDCIYNYSWGVTAGMVENQMSALKNQKALGGVDMMVTMSMGRDDTPWERTAGSFASVEDFSRLLKWSKEEFIPSLPSNSLGRKFVMFGNWNEYGEGHFLSPCNLEGFGYLDEIRKAFTDTKKHKDIRPTENQRERINHLYVQDRIKPKPFTAVAPEITEIPENVKLGYTFDSGAQGWTVAKQIDGFTAENGVLKGTSTDADPGLYTPAGLGMTVGDVTHIRLRMRASVPAPSITFYYITENDTAWAESKSFKSMYRQDDNEFHEIILETAGSTSWKGKLEQMRLDPLTEPGTFEIDSVEFLSISKEGELALAVDGEQQFFQRKVVMQNDVFMVPAAEVASLLNCSWKQTINCDAVALLTGEGSRENYFYLPYGNPQGMWNGKSLPLPEPACVIEEQVYFPIRPIAEALGYQVQWNNELNQANLITPLDGEEDYVAPSEPDPVGTYNFHEPGNLQGWSPNGNVSGAKVKNSVLTFQSLGTDPVFSQGCRLEAEKYPYLYIRVKNASSGTKFQLYFATEDSPGLSESKSVSVKMEANSKEFVTYTADMSSNRDWKGTVTTLRMDPTDNRGEVAIDYVILSDELPSAHEEGDEGVNLISNGVMDAQKFVYTVIDAKADYSAEQAYIGRYSLAVAQQPKGAIYIPAPMERDKTYAYQFRIYMPQPGKVSVGLINSKGERQEAAETEIVTAGIWTLIRGTFTQGELLTQPQFYITADANKYYLDQVVLRQK